MPQIPPFFLSWVPVLKVVTLHGPCIGVTHLSHGQELQDTEHCLNGVTFRSKRKKGKEKLFVYLQACDCCFSAVMGSFVPTVT